MAKIVSLLDDTCSKCGIYFWVEDAGCEACSFEPEEDKD